MIKEFTIKSEISSEHWGECDFKNKNILDLGCGRWDIPDLKDTSPFYFSSNGALSLIGVDILQSEINYFNSCNINNCKFICTSIDSASKVKNLILDYSIDAIKCDIEGYEINLLELTNEDLINVKSIWIEYHGHHLKSIFEKKLPEWGFKIYSIGYLCIDGYGVIFAKK